MQPIRQLISKLRDWFQRWINENMTEIAWVKVTEINNTDILYIADMLPSSNGILCMSCPVSHRSLVLWLSEIKKLPDHIELHTVFFEIDFRLVLPGNDEHKLIH